MKNKVIVVALFTLLTPSLVFASWWNPFTWFNSNTQTVPVETKQTHPDVTPDLPVIPNTTIQSNVAPKNNNIKNKIPVVIKKTTTTSNTPAIPQTPPPVTVAPIDPRQVAINQLLQDPTFENFKAFCVTAKSIQGNGTKQVLDSSRENLITTPLTFYDNLKICQTLDNGKDYVVYNLPDNSLLLTLSSNDTDEVREFKIRYNDALKVASEKDKFIIFQPIFNAENSTRLNVDGHSISATLQYFMNDLSKNTPVGILNSNDSKETKNAYQRRKQSHQSDISELNNLIVYGDYKTVSDPVAYLRNLSFSVAKPLSSVK